MTESLSWGEILGWGEGLGMPPLTSVGTRCVFSRSQATKRHYLYPLSWIQPAQSIHIPRT